MVSKQPTTKGALSDLKVLELGSMLAGPFVGSMLADFGAQVVKVEKPGKPDALREWPPHGSRLGTSNLLPVMVVLSAVSMASALEPGSVPQLSDWRPAGLQPEQPCLFPSLRTPLRPALRHQLERKRNRNSPCFRTLRNI